MRGDAAAKPMALRGTMVARVATTVARVATTVARVAATAALIGIAACGRTPAPTPGGAQKAAALPALPPDSLRAVVESVHLAHTVAPDETLRVRLVGTVGPDGSWAADGVGVQHEPGRVVLVPRVRRVAG